MRHWAKLIDFARHGHSRDEKPHNPQVIVGVVMVAGWPIAHHVWAGNRVDSSTVSEAIRDLHDRFGFNRLVFVGDRGMVTDDILAQVRTKPPRTWAQEIPS
jgi:transposase